MISGKGLAGGPAVVLFTKELVLVLVLKAVEGSRLEGFGVDANGGGSWKSNACVQQGLRFESLDWLQCRMQW